MFEKIRRLTSCVTALKEQKFRFVVPIIMLVCNSTNARMHAEETTCGKFKNQFIYLLFHGLHVHIDRIHHPFSAVGAREGQTPYWILEEKHSDGCSPGSKHVSMFRFMRSFQGCPPNFSELLVYLDSLSFLDAPCYNLFRRTFNSSLKNLLIDENDPYDWEIYQIDSTVRHFTFLQSHCLGGRRSNSDIWVTFC